MKTIKGSRNEIASVDKYPATIKSIDELREDLIAQLLTEGKMTREELAAETYSEIRAEMTHPNRLILFPKKIHA